MVCLALALKSRHGSADVREFIDTADNKNSKRREKELATGACLTASNFQITCKWELFIKQSVHCRDNLTGNIIYNLYSTHIVLISCISFVDLWL